MDVIAVDMIVNRVVFRVAKARPDDLFAAGMFDVREKVKELKEKWSQAAAEKMRRELTSDLSAKTGAKVELSLSLGKYKGSRFVTSAKLRVRVPSEKAANDMLPYLQSKYSPKYKLKSISDDGYAEFNIR